MSSLSALFVINNYGQLEINKPEVLKMEEFAILFKRDKGSEGDTSGRAKLIACGEIYYIYLVYDIRSVYYNLPIVERKKKARTDARLPSNWKEDKELEAAVARYKEEFKLTSTGNAYAVAEKAYYTLTKDTGDMQEALIDIKASLTTILAKIESKVKKGTDIEVVGLAADAQQLIAQAVKIQKDMRENIKQFDGLGNTVKILAAKFIEEGGNVKTPVGGGKINSREL